MFTSSNPHQLRIYSNQKVSKKIPTRRKKLQTSHPPDLHLFTVRIFIQGQHSILLQTACSGVRLPEFTFHSYLAAWLYTNYSTTLNLNFCICKMGIILFALQVLNWTMCVRNLPQFLVHCKCSLLSTLSSVQHIQFCHAVPPMCKILCQTHFKWCSFTLGYLFSRPCRLETVSKGENLLRQTH